MKGIGTGGTRVLLLHPAAFHKQASGGGGGGVALLAAPHRLWLLALVGFFTFASLLTLFTSTTTSADRPVGPTRGGSGLTSGDASDVLEASLLHYAATSSNVSGGMPEPDLRRVASLIRRRAPCNLLVFGLGHESLLWRALNRGTGGRTVFLDESEYRVSRFEERHTGEARLEAYDVGYTTRVGELRELLASARERRTRDCKAVQNLLFSDCRLAINDLPNHIYDIPWDVVLVDGPRGYTAASPGRMAAIFTAGVLARSTGGGDHGVVDVLVHDFDREAERMCSDEFLCAENLVDATGGQLAHFQIRRRGANAEAFEFCEDRNASFPSPTTISSSSPSLTASAKR